MKLSRSVAYAVQATLELAQRESGVPIPCSQLAAAGNLPERFLLQILRRLVTHSILRSTLGTNGGYSLERKPGEISLLDIIEAIDGPLATDLPAVESGKQSVSEGKLRAAIEQVTLGSRCELQAIKLSDLLGPQSLSKVATGVGPPLEGGGHLAGHVGPVTTF